MKELTYISFEDAERDSQICLLNFTHEQEIEMYLSNILVKDKEPSQITNE